MKRALLGLLIGLAIGIPAGAVGWYLYDGTSNENGTSEERERADAFLAEVFLRNECVSCNVSSLEQIEPDVWRAVIAYGPSQTFCIRVDLHDVRASEITDIADFLTGSATGVRKTSCT
jgi:hypothetical protein